MADRVHRYTGVSTDQPPTPTGKLDHELFWAQLADTHAVTIGCSVKSQTAQGNGRK